MRLDLHDTGVTIVHYYDVDVFLEEVWPLRLVRKFLFTSEGQLSLEQQCELVAHASTWLHNVVCAGQKLRCMQVTRQCELRQQYDWSKEGLAAVQLETGLL